VATNSRILFICSPSRTLHSFNEILLARLSAPIIADTLKNAEPILARVPLDLVVCASELIDGTYRDVLRMMKRRNCAVPVLVISLCGRETECREARQLGAADCMPRPMSHDEVQIVIDRAFDVISRTQGDA
jgi:DNA-binding NtrC family response regulator